MNKLRLGLMRIPWTRYEQALDVWKSRLDNGGIWNGRYKAGRRFDGLNGMVSWEIAGMLRGVGWLTSVIYVWGQGQSNVHIILRIPTAG